MADQPRLKPLTLEEIAVMSAAYPDIDPASLEAYNELARTTRMLVAVLDRAAQFRPNGMSVGRNAVLWSVVRYPDKEGITPAEIATVLDITRATVTGLLSALEQDGLVKRIPSSEDRRKIHVRPTPRARALIDTEWPAGSKDITLAMAELTAAEKSQLLKILRKIRLGTNSLKAPN